MVVELRDLRLGLDSGVEAVGDLTSVGIDYYLALALIKSCELEPFSFIKSKTPTRPGWAKEVA